MAFRFHNRDPNAASELAHLAARLAVAIKEGETRQSILSSEVIYRLSESSRRHEMLDRRTNLLDVILTLHQQGKDPKGFVEVVSATLNARWEQLLNNQRIINKRAKLLSCLKNDGMKLIHRGQAYRIFWDKNVSFKKNSLPSIAELLNGIAWLAIEQPLTGLEAGQLYSAQLQYAAIDPNTARVLGLAYSELCRYSVLGPSTVEDRFLIIPLHRMNEALQAPQSVAGYQFELKESPSRRHQLNELALEGAKAKPAFLTLCRASTE